MVSFFTRSMGSLAIITLVAAFFGGSEYLHRFRDKTRDWQYAIMSGLIGGAVGIYGTLSGVNYDGAVISVRDVGPMFAGFLGGPWGGLIAGVIAGLHLFGSTNDVRARVLDCLAAEHPKVVIPMHCTGLEAIVMTKLKLGDRCILAGAGDQYEF